MLVYDVIIVINACVCLMALDIVIYN